MRRYVPALVSLVALMAVSCGPSAQDTADAIYVGGSVITMNDAQPAAEAVAVRDGKILAVGARADVMKHKGEATHVVDLAGHTLLPGFIDAHSHVSAVGLQAVSANLLPPPDGSAATITGIQELLLDYMATSPTPVTFGVVFGFGYDDSQLEQKRHPTRDDLDAVSTSKPVLIVHQSGHLGVLNSKALQMAGITSQTPDPQGGVIRRRAGSSEPNGVVEEAAFFSALGSLYPDLDKAQAIAMLDAGLDLYMRYGYTTVQDGRATPADVNTAIAAAQEGKLPVDVVSYPDVLQIGSELFMTGPYYKPGYTDHFRIGGVKVTLDGSPQGKTAWLTRPYYEVPEGRPQGYAGYSAMPEAKVLEVYTSAFKNNWQVLTHANGDGAIDQMIRNIRIAESRVPGKDRRPVLIHGQTLREDQVDSLVALGIFPSLFPMHTFYWGDWHRESVLGPERAENISPTGWLVERGMMFTTHHDAPVALPSSIRVLASTVNRTTRSGYVLGPQHCVEPIVALKAMTLWAAYQYFEEHSKGSIEVGKLADFVVLSDNPLTVERAKLADLKVLETIKEGTTVFRAR